MISKKIKKMLVISSSLVVMLPVGIISSKMITNKQDNSNESIITNNDLIFNKILNAKMFNWENLDVCEAFNLIDKEWIIKNNDILFEKSNLNSISDITKLEKSIKLDQNSNAIISLNVNNQIGEILNINLISTKSTFYNVSSWPLTSNGAINIHSSILETNKLYEAVSEYLIIKFNDFANQNKSSVVMDDYILKNKSNFLPAIENNNFVWNFNLKDKDMNFKNALALSFFKTDWSFVNNSNNLFDSLISNINIYAQIIDNDFLTKKYEFTKIEILFNDGVNSQIIEINKDQFKNINHFIVSFNRNDDIPLGYEVLANQNLSFALKTLNEKIAIENIVQDENILNKNLQDMSNNITSEIIFKNKEKIFYESQYLLQENFIESISFSSIDKNYDSFNINIKWKNIPEITSIKFSISQNNRLVNSGLSLLYTCPVDSTTEFAIEAKSESMDEILDKTSKYILNRQIQNFQNINNKEYGFILPLNKVYPTAISSANNRIKLSMNGWSDDASMKDIYFKMTFRTIWKSKWEDIKSKNQTYKIIPNIDNIKDIEIEWQVVKKQDETYKACKVYTVIPYSVKFIYNSNESILWLFDENYLISKNIAYNEYFVINPNTPYDYIDFDINTIA